MGQYCYAGWHLLSSVMLLAHGNAADGQADQPPGVLMVGAQAAGHVGGQAANTARRASTVTSPLRRHLV